MNYKIKFKYGGKHYIVDPKNIVIDMKNNMSKLFLREKNYCFYIMLIDDIKTATLIDIVLEKIKKEK